MYSPAERPSRTRAAPAKKRMLSEHTGISSRAYDSGLPTFRDSISASSSAFASSTSASLSRTSARSAGVDSSHSGSAPFAAATARPTSSASQRGTSAIVSSVAGFSTSIVSPATASTHSPPIRTCRVAPVVVIGEPSSCSCSQNAGLARQALRNGDGNDRRNQDHEDDYVDLGQLLPDADVAEDPDRESVLRSRGERGDDHLVEREREREQRARDERRGDRRQRDEPERLPPVGAEVHRSLGERRRRSPQSRDHVVEHDHDAERRMADDDRPQAEVHL